MAKQQNLICREGDHKWSRPSQRGKPPFYCPKHAPEPVEKKAPEDKTLTCSECNKEWVRPAKRGRVPSRCPDCTPDAPVRRSKVFKKNEMFNVEENPNTQPKKDIKKILVTQTMMDITKGKYPDCKCEALGLAVGSNYGSLLLLGAGCTASHAEIIIDKDGGKHWIESGSGWVCSRLDSVRSYFRKNT